MIILKQMAFYVHVCAKVEKKYMIDMITEMEIFYKR